jgi:hypothetical protein
VYVERAKKDIALRLSCAGVRLAAVSTERSTGKLPASSTISPRAFLAPRATTSNPEHFCIVFL